MLSEHDAAPRDAAKEEDAPSPHQLGHLSGHHRETVSQILQHPVSHNIEWRAVVSLLHGVAQVEETRNGKLLVTLRDETETLEPSKHKCISAQQVVDVRRMLKGAGFCHSRETPSPAR